MGLLFRYNVLSMLARPTATLSSVVLIGLVVAVFAYLQAITDSAFKTMAGTGDERTIIVLSQQAESETVSGIGQDLVNKLELTPGLQRGPDGALVSPEMVAIGSARTGESTEDDDVHLNVSFRGVNYDVANAVRHGRVRMVAGRSFEPGTYEVIVGEAAARLFTGLKLGDEVQIGTRGNRMFKVVGVFSTGGTAADSEVWGYVETLRDVYARTGWFSSVRLLMDDVAAVRPAIDYLTGPAVEVGAKSEKEYFQTLSTNQTATQVLSLAMIVIMGIAAAFAIANTMYAAVAGRGREIGMLRAVGFPRPMILAGFVLEGVALAGLGGVLGVLASLACNGMQRNILPSTFTTVSYTLQIDAKIMATSLAAALVIGLLGSLMPAARAARISVVQSLREA